MVRLISWVLLQKQLALVPRLGLAFRLDERHGGHHPTNSTMAEANRQ